MSKVGVVLCRCNSIIDSKLDFNHLSEKMANEKNVHSVIQVDMACSSQGKKAIEELAAIEDVDRLVVAACSPLAKGAVFEGYAREFNLPGQHIEIVNLREQCAWVHDGGDAVEKALILLKMGLKRVIKAKDVGQWQVNHAYINKIKCDKCKRCIEECPNKAIQLGNDGYPAVAPEVCQRCGVCVGGCPLGVISLPDFRLEEISAMMAPVASAKSPAIVGFFCDYTYGEADLMGQIGSGYSPNLYIIKVPCTGAVNMIMVNDAIAEGIDGIIVAGCDSSQCQLRKGNELARYRIANAQKGLEEQFLEKERLSYVALGEGLVEPSIINQQKCAGCGLCRQVCPYGAIKMVEDGKFEVNGKACRGCGTCVSSCRSGAIDLPYCTDEKIITAMKILLAS